MKYSEHDDEYRTCLERRAQRDLFKLMKRNYMYTFPRYQFYGENKFVAFHLVNKFSIFCVRRNPSFASGLSHMNWSKPCISFTSYFPPTSECGEGVFSSSSPYFCVLRNEGIVYLFISNIKIKY
jgi:hypothetical protein